MAKYNVVVSQDIAKVALTVCTCTVQFCITYSNFLHIYRAVACNFGMVRPQSGCGYIVGCCVGVANTTVRRWSNEPRHLLWVYFLKPE